MYWGLVFLGVSLLSLPFALDQPAGAAAAAVALAAVFAVLSLLAFALGRGPSRAKAQRRTEDAPPS